MATTVFDCANRKAPSYKVFQNSVLRILGKLTGFIPHQIVPQSKDLTHRIIQDVGLDPTNLPEGMVLNIPGPKRKGIYRQVVLAYRFLHYPSKLGGNPALVVSGSPRHWGLTEEGVQAARVLCKEEPNATANWFSKHLDEHLLQTIRASIAKACPISANVQMIDDHVNTFIERQIHRDSLRKRIEKGLPISYSQIVAFARRSAWTDIRNSGTEPVCRGMLGAKTERERDRLQKQEKEAPITAIPAQCFETVDGQNISFSNTEGFVDLERGESFDSPDTMITFERVWTKLVQVMQRVKPQSYERYLGILQMQVFEGRTVKEIAQTEGVTAVRASTMLQEARRAIRSVGIRAFQ